MTYRPAHWPSLAVLALAVVALSGVSLPTLAAEPAKADAAKSATATPKGPAITVTQAKAGLVSDMAIVGGTLIAREEIMVAAQLEGLAIVEILVDEGARVKAGDVLARLNREMIDVSILQNKAQRARADAAIAQARAQITEAEALRVAASNSFGRARSLREDGITSAETLDQRQAAATQAIARVTSAQQALKLAEADKAVADAQAAELDIRLKRTEIKAPTAGIVSRRTARLGSIAAGAADPLFRIIENGAVELEADVAEGTLTKLKEGQAAIVRPAGFETDLVARVRLVSPEVSRTTRLGKVRLALVDAPPLPVGAFARGTIEVARSNGIVLPLSAVQFGPEGARVQVVVNDTVETRVVTTGLRSSSMIEITKGLAANEQVVTLAGTFLRNGDRVSPVLAQATQ
ncbi:MAG: efflux RND transporter periplasmic adaptor subunit [Bosea sp. (in: a-proteobacteria)]